MKLRRLFYLIFFSVIPLFGCSDPKEKQLIELTLSKNYSQLMSLFNEELTNGNTRILKRPIDGKAEPSDSTIFVRAALTLLSSSTYSASNTGLLLLNNKNSIESYFFLVHEVIDLSIKNGIKTPEHLDNFLYQVYTEQFDELDDNYKSKLDQLIRTDTVYIERINTSILREINTSKDLNRILSLLDLAKIEAPSRLFNLIYATEKRLVELRNVRYARGMSFSNVNARISRIENKYGEIEIRLAKSSYLFRGYMIAQLASDPPITYYEVRDGSGTTYVLMTTETKFTTRGYFSMRVIAGSTATLPTNQSYGGFDKNIQFLTELRAEIWNKYKLYTQEVQPLESELRSLQGSTNYDTQIEALESQLAKQKSELFNWIKSNLSI